jgi:uncharacterized protein (TIGR00730 family)
MATEKTQRQKDDRFEFDVHKMSRVQVHQAIHRRLDRIYNEFMSAFEFIKKYPESVTFFGSARFKEDDPYYQKARTLAGKIVKELGYSVLSGGGGGIMEASNRGAFEAGGKSVGLNIRLPNEQLPNKYTQKTLEVSYFFIRKVALSFAAEAYIFFPGGFGTLDEFFEIVTLIQTKKIPRVPVILVGNEYWGSIRNFLENIALTKHNAILKEDLDIFTITENDEEIIDIIKKVPIRDHIDAN